MNNKDQQLISQAYILVYEERQLNKELDFLLQQEGIISNTLDAINQGREAVSGTIKDIAQLPEQLSNWSQVQIPEFITKVGDFLLNIGLGALVGGTGTYALGKFFMYLSKKISKEADANYDSLKSMLPVKVQEKVQELENLKSQNPKEYDLQVFSIHKNAMKELKKNLNSKGIKTEAGVLAKSLDILGRSLSSAPGSIAGAIVIPVVMFKLGFNPFPAFPPIGTK